MSETIADRLAAARAAHQRYRAALPHRAEGDPTGPILPGDPAAARQALQDAYDARAQAIADDPEQHDPAWQAEAASVYDNHELLMFYREQLARVH